MVFSKKSTGKMQKKPKTAEEETSYKMQNAVRVSVQKHFSGLPDLPSSSIDIKILWTGVDKRVRVRANWWEKGKCFASKYLIVSAIESEKVRIDEVATFSNSDLMQLAKPDLS